MAVQSPQELFLYKLAEMYDVEQKLAQTLPVLAKEVESQEAKQTFLQHEQETRQHARNLEQCFQMLGYQPAVVESQALKGLKLDHDAFVQQQPSPPVLTMFDLKAGSDSEAMEISKYGGLIDDANNMGLLQVVPLLYENMLQDEAAEKELKKRAHELNKRRA